jgi:hypothetical protein
MKTERFIAKLTPETSCPEQQIPFAFHPSVTHQPCHQLTTVQLPLKFISNLTEGQ